MPEEISLRDIYEVSQAYYAMAERGLDRLSVSVTLSQKELKEEIKAEMEDLIDATNHKVDTWRKQFLAIIGAIIAVSTPVIVNNWGLLIAEIRNYL